MAFARWWYATHGDKKASGASSTSGEKKAEMAEKPPASAAVSQPPKTQASGAPSAAKQQPPSVDASEPQLTKPSDTKLTPSSKPEAGKNTLSTQPTDSQNKQPSEERQKEPSGAQSPTSTSVETTSKPNNTGKATTAPTEQAPQAASVETAKAESEKMSAVAGAGTASASVVAAADGSKAEPGMDESALDRLMDTLGGPEEDLPTSPLYSGPEVKEDVSSTYLEELGKWESTLPPEYVKLLKSKGDGKYGVPPKEDGRDEKPMTDRELAEALSSDFFPCGAAPDEEKTSVTEKPSKEGEIVQAQAASTIKASVPPERENIESDQEIKDGALESFRSVLSGSESEPEKHLTPVVEVSEAKAKEKKEEKTVERDDTIPPECRYTPEVDKDGKPVLPKPEEKPKVGGVADEALEALSSSLGKREPDPEEKKPAVDKVKKTKQEKCKKLGEHEETIPLDYRSTETQDKDGKVLLPKPEEEFQPMSENDLTEGLTEGFSPSPSPSALLPTVKAGKKSKKGGKAAGSLDVVSAAADSSVPSAATPSSTSGEEEMEKALDLLSDSLGQKEPDPDENKPVVDKVKEKATSEHRDKLGERDETIPPKYVKLLELDEQKPADDSAAIDTLSGDFYTCVKAPARPQHSKTGKLNCIICGPWHIV
ncbi:calpastatin [Porphyrio hochstetteri]